MHKARAGAAPAERVGAVPAGRAQVERVPAEPREVERVQPELGEVERVQAQVREAELQEVGRRLAPRAVVAPMPLALWENPGWAWERRCITGSIKSIAGCNKRAPQLAGLLYSPRLMQFALGSSCAQFLMCHYNFVGTARSFQWSPFSPTWHRRE